MIVIPDASVILKWLLPGNISPFQAQALAIRDAALTIAQSAVFVTADEKYVHKSKHSTHICLLKDWH